MKRVVRNSGMILLAAILIFADQVTKSLAQKFFEQPSEVWRGILTFRLSMNPGIAFSIPIPNVVIIVVVPIVLGALFMIIKKSCDTTRLTTGLIVAFFAAGGIGNVLDRLQFGAVRDFISFSFWPSFNLADTFVTIAAFLLIVFYGKISLRNH